MARQKVGANRRQGFSIIELVLGLAIVSIFLGMTVITLRQSISQEGPRALAYTVTSDLKAARAEAQRSGNLVAFCLPSDGKTNSFSHNAVVRKGQQSGHLHKILNYGREYRGFIFAGAWSGSVLETHEVTPDWRTSTQEEMAIYFRPDGTAFSNDIPAVQGNYPLVVGSAFQSSGGGPSATLSAIKNPHTIWVSQAGTITIDEKKVPVGTLALGGNEPTVAALDYMTAPSTDIGPKIRDIKFLPETIVGLDSVGMSQNYVNVHPDQKDSERLEYGIATMLILATDRDGGPLYYDLEGFSSEGGIGKFSVSKKSGAMDYVLNEDDNIYYWQALVSWRPPPGADEDTEYELRVTVRDEDGNTDETSSGAGLLPKIGTLAPVRLVMATADGHLYLANIEGGSCIKLTDTGFPERNPFFSQDGSRIYSFMDTPSGGQQFRVRNADGSRSYRVLRNFAADVTRTLQYDPTYTYVAYLDPTSPAPTVYPYKTPRFVPTDDDDNGYYVLDDNSRNHNGRRLEVLHLLADEPPVAISTRSEGGFHWDANHRHTLDYDESQGVPENAYQRPARQHPATGQLGPYIPWPAYTIEDRATRLTGFPPTTVPGSSSGLDASTRSYNPADDKWYVFEDGGQLRLGNRTDPSVNRRIHSGGIRGKARWSSNGEQIAFIAENGSNRTVKVVHIMDGDPLRPRSSFAQRFEYRGRSVKDAQLDPDAKFAFYLEGGNLFRAVNSRGASGVNLSDHLGKALDSYVVSP